MLSAMKFGLRDFDRLLASGFAVDEKLNDFPSSTIQSGKSSVICGVSRGPRIGLTVKFKGTTPRIILPSDLPSKPSAWERYVAKGDLLNFSELHPGADRRR
jgi:hypothetical protein